MFFDFILPVLLIGIVASLVAAMVAYAWPFLLAALGMYAAFMLLGAWATL